MLLRSYDYRDGGRYSTPGVYFENLTARRAPGFVTGTPAFIGFAKPRPSSGAGTERGLPRPHSLTSWNQLHERFALTPACGYLDDAVRGFFENGGVRCVVAPMPFEANNPSFGQTDLEAALASLESLDDVDLICVPDLVFAGRRIAEAQQAVLKTCGSRTGRFAILDSLPLGATSEAGRRLATGLDDPVSQWRSLAGKDGALYFPWLRANRSSHPWIPPCGHVAGIYARSDARIGVHKAPANEIVEGAVDLEIHLDDAAHGRLNQAGINCLTALPARGIRVMGARTLIGLSDWQYVNVRRLFLTLVRRIDYSFRSLAFEPHTPALWEKIRSGLNVLCGDLFEAGALLGLTPAEAYFVKCDAETNPVAARDSGEVIAEVGLAVVSPAEFVVVRIAHGAAGTMLAPPAQS